MKVVHIPFSNRNPYQKLLSDRLRAGGITVEGAKIHHVMDISFLNLSLFTLLFHHWKPDIIHLHWQSSFLYVAGSRLKTNLKSLLFLFQLWILKFLGIKLVWTVHNLKRHEGTYRDLEAYYTRKLVRMVDRIIVHCQYAHNIIKRQFGNELKEKIVIIGHGNFCDYYPNTIDSEEARNNLGLPVSRQTLLFFGELRRYKGIFDLIETFLSLNNENIQLLIAGHPHDNEISEEIRRNINGHENISAHMQYIPDGKVQYYIKAADVMVFPYRDIFTSGSIFLALSFGKPIIAPELGCITDLLKNTNNFTYNPNEETGLKTAIQEMVESKDQLYKISRNNFELAFNSGWNGIAIKTIDTYKICLKT